MKKLVEFGQLYLEALAAFEAFRRLGFLPDDIWLGFGTLQNVGDDVLYLQARQGDRSFVMFVGQLVGAPPELVHQTWQEVGDLWNVAPEADRQTIWENSQVKAQGVALVAALTLKGFTLPRPEPDSSLLN